MEGKELKPDDLLEDVYEERPRLLAGTSQHIQKIFSKIQKRDANKVDFWSAEGVRAWCDLTTGLSADTLDKCLALLHQNEIDDIRLFQGLSRSAFERFLGPYPQFAYPMYASAQLYKAWIRDPTAKAHKASCPSQSATASATQSPSAACARAGAASPSAARGGHAAVGKSTGSHYHKSKRLGSDDLKDKHGRKKKPRMSDSDRISFPDAMEEDDGHDFPISSTPSPASEPRHRKRSTTPTSALVGAKSSRIFRSSSRPSGSSSKRGSSSSSSGGRAAAAVAAARIRKSSGIKETSTGPSAARVKPKTHAKAVKPVKTQQQKGGFAGKSTAAASSSSSSSSSARRATCNDPLITAIAAIRGNDRLKPTSPLVAYAMPMTDAPHMQAFEVLLSILTRQGESAVLLRAVLTRLWQLIQNTEQSVAKTHALTLRDMGVGDAFAAAVNNQLKSSKKHDKASEVLLIALQTAALVLNYTEGVKKEAKLCEAVQKAFRSLPRSAPVYRAGLPLVTELAACKENAIAMIDAKLNVEIARALTVMKSGKDDLVLEVVSAVSQLGDFASKGIEVDLEQLGDDDLCDKLVKAMSELPLGMELESLRQCVGVIMVLCRCPCNTERVGKAGGCRLLAWWLNAYLEGVKDGSVAKKDEEVQLFLLALRNLAGSCAANEDELGKAGICDDLLQLVTERDETNNELVNISDLTITDNLGMVKEVIACIWSLTEHSNANRSKFGAAGVISWIIKLLPQHPEPWLHEQALGALSCLALSPDSDYVNVERIVAVGGCEAVMDALHENQAGLVVEAGCQALAALAMRPTSAAILGTRACEILTKAVQRFPGKSLLVSEALRGMTAMLQHVQGRAEVLKTLRDGGAPEAVKSVMTALTPVKNEEGGAEDGGDGEVEEDVGGEDAHEKERKLLELKEKRASCRS